MSTPSTGFQSFVDSLSATNSGLPGPSPNTNNPNPPPSEQLGDGGFASFVQQHESASQQIPDKQTPTQTPEQDGGFASFVQNSTNPQHNVKQSGTNQTVPADEGTLSKIWRIANTPLSEDLGIPEYRQGAGGIERGAEKLLSGFTSPLSLLLTIGTLGTGGFIESTGANVLKETLMAGGLDAAAAAQKTEQFATAAKAASEAYNTTDKSVKAAVEGAGMDYNEFRSLGNTLYDRGLTENDVIGGNIIQRGLSASLRSLPKMDAVTAQKLAKYTQLGMDAGFTGQQLHAAGQTIPQVFDALKDGRYDDALEYTTEGVVSGALGLVGAAHALNQAGETFSSVNERENLRPSDENQKLNGFFGDRDLSHQDANQQSANLMQELRDLAGAKTGTTFSPSVFDNIKAGLKYVFQSKEERQAFQDKMDRALVGMETGNDPELARQLANALAEATGVSPSLSKINPEGTFARYNPGEHSETEQEVINLGLNKPLREVSAKDIADAGGSQALQSKWSDYMKDRLRLPHKDSDGNYLVTNEHVSNNVAVSNLPATPYSPHAVVLNPYAAELVNRVLEDEKHPEAEKGEVSARNWQGLHVSGSSLDALISALKEQSKDISSENRQGYDWLIDSLEKGRNTSGSVILAHENPELNDTIAHESTHYWLNRISKDFTPEQYKKVTDFMKSGVAPKGEIPANPILNKALTSLVQLGYPRKPSVLFHELGAYLSEGGGIFKKFEDDSLSDDELKQLAKDYISVHNKEDLKSFPSEHPLIQGALEENGYKGINKGAASPVFRGTTAGQGAFDEQPDFAAARVRDASVPRQHPGLPENIREWVDQAKTTLKPEQKTYLNRWVKAYQSVADGLSDEEKNFVDRLRQEDDKNWNIGNTMGLITSHIDNHIHHVWGPDEDKIGNELIQQGRTGKLETTVTQARQRVWDTFAEGLLKGRKIAADDPISLVAWDRANILKAAANRNFIDSLRDNFVRGSDGRPLVVLSGEGHVVQEPNGENPAAIINPNRVRDIRIANNAVETMAKTGELDRFLKRGDILDVTKKFRTGQIDDAINRLEQIGIHKTPEFKENGDVILRQDIRTIQGIKNGSIPASALDEINARWNKPQYVWHPQDYVTPANRTIQGWNWLTKTEDGTNLMARSDVKFHPEAAQYMINRLGLDKSYLRENKGIGKITGPILKGGTEAKAVLLSFSPFHLMQEALRGVMMGVNPIRLDPIGEISKRPEIANAVREGATLSPDRHSIQEYSIGVAQHAPFISKIPVLGKAMDWYQDFLFNRYIPSLKAQSIEVMSSKYRAAHPDWSDQAVGKAVAEHVNNAFGGQNWRAMGRAAATQDWFHLFALAPDWLESEMRFAGSTLRGGLGQRNFSREQTLKMAAGLWGLARVLNMVNTGDMHLEAPFGVATKDKDGREVVYSIRTLPVDILHMASDPVGFVKGRLSPFARLSEEALTGRDVFGRKLNPGDLAIDIGRNMAPIPFQTLGQIATGQSAEVGNTGQFAKAVGLTANVYRTEAQKLAIQLASERNENGPLDPRKLQHLEVVSHIEDGLRSGNMTHEQLEDAKDFGTLTQQDYNQIRDNVKLTRGLDPDTARMVSKVSRLPMTDALSVWDAATPNEKVALTKIMIKKKQSYMSKAMRDESPQQRLTDPVFRRIRLLFRQPEGEEQP